MSYSPQCNLCLSAQEAYRDCGLVACNWIACDRECLAGHLLRCVAGEYAVRPEADTGQGRAACSIGGIAAVNGSAGRLRQGKLRDEQTVLVGRRRFPADENLKMNWGKPGLGAITIATLRGEPDKAAIFAYEKGATMNSEFLAPARRLSFFLWQNTFEQLRPEGLALFRAAVLWCVTRPD